MNIISLNANNFSQVIEQYTVVVVDFWAQWCQPCKALAKIIEVLAPRYPDVIFGTVDIEQEKELAQDFNIASVPAVLILKQQVVVYADSGLLPESGLAELLDKAIALDVSQLK